MRKRRGLGVAVLLLWVGWLAVSFVYRPGEDRTVEPDQVPAVEVEEPNGSLSWTVAEAEAALARSPVARLPGSPAVVDEARVRAALAGTGRKVLLLPYSGVDTRNQHDARVREVRAAVGRNTLVVASGLNVSAPVGSVVPSSMDEARQVLATGDLTTFLLTAIKERSHDLESLPPTAPADPAEVDAVTRDLAANRVHTAPGIEPVTDTDRWDDIVPGAVVRIAVLPPAAPETPRTDLTAALGERFPGDLVVVVRGLWVEFSAPDPELSRITLSGYYGAHFGQLAKWGPRQVNLGLALAREYATLLANRAAVLAPRRAADPVPFVLTGLPWVFAGTVAVVGGSVLAVRRRAARRRRGAEEARRVERERLSAALAGIAAGITDLDGLARDGRAGRLVDHASERYGVARELLARDGDVPTARAAVDEARTALESAAQALEVAR
ncbi:hypothetical protein [Actinophytocola xanthii]|uniref:DUF4350 domain-containing protein n=1 Tax=Actinophytocola xanthii TaxID=1912961 RepID=A0A1Q8CWL4_9PSEU|nr:hypothetical protein [Actinophytocola xanthii]OLF18738.1 hypothetical protein BU204_04305 [Actinophytocola xanthii]